ncbi:MAG: internalization-like protein competence protein ComEC/Rec2, competence protein ComEC protein [Candidatus Kaiserbacteria bacterium]|nr:internalization-like protein competence protein ComEC/Rec2, competence protein ComEC protein [Candidatus Kaiserbacteria bacterium]
MHITIAPSGASVVTLIRTPGNKSILIGGGSDASVLRIVSSILPWYQHSLDTLILPQIDAVHSGGTIDLLRRYQIPIVLMESAAGKGAEWVSLLDALRSVSSSARKVPLMRGEILSTDDGLYIRALLPDRNMPHADSHTACSPLKIVYGATAALLMCDINPAILPYLAFLDGSTLEAQIVVLPESVFKSNNVDFLLGFAKPREVVVMHVCTQGIASTTLRTIQKFNARSIDPCSVPVSIESNGTIIVFR